MIEAAETRRGTGDATVHFGEGKAVLMEFPESGSKFSCSNQRWRQLVGDSKDAILCISVRKRRSVAASGWK